MNVQEIALSKIFPPALQPRFTEDEDGIQELADSIREHGLLSPLTVTTIEDNDSYRLIAGNRRLQALRKLQAASAPCNVVTADPRLADELTIAENLFRLNLSPVEEAYAFALYLQRTEQSQDQLASRIRKERTYVTRRLMLLDLDEGTLAAIENGSLTLSEALLLRRVDDIEVRAKFIEHAENWGCNARTMAAWVGNYERDRARMQAVEGRSPTAAEVDIPRQVFMDCERCSTPTNYEVLRAMYVCPGCRQKILLERLNATGK